MKIKDESLILDEQFRQKILKEIDGPENTARKDEALRRFDVYKDYIKYYMVEILQKELDPETVDEMVSRTSVVNLLKKIVTKKARVYKTGVDRNFGEQAQDMCNEIYEYLRANMCYKKANRFLELAKNALLCITPKECDDGKWSYCMRPKFPHQYDVIEDARDPEKPLVIIFSPHTRTGETYDLRINEGRGFGAYQANFRAGDGIDQTIADSPSDGADSMKDSREFVWWSKNFHFTTNSKGQIISDKSPDDLLNQFK